MYIIYPSADIDIDRQTDRSISRLPRTSMVGGSGVATKATQLSSASAAFNERLYMYIIYLSFHIYRHGWNARSCDAPPWWVAPAWRRRRPSCLGPRPPLTKVYICMLYIFLSTDIDIDGWIHHATHLHGWRLRLYIYI